MAENEFSHDLHSYIHLDLTALTLRNYPAQSKWRPLRLCLYTFEKVMGDQKIEVAFWQHSGLGMIMVSKQGKQGRTNVLGKKITPILPTKSILYLIASTVRCKLFEVEC